MVIKKRHTSKFICHSIINTTYVLILWKHKYIALTYIYTKLKSKKRTLRRNRCQIALKLIQFAFKILPASAQKYRTDLYTLKPTNFVLNAIEFVLNTVLNITIDNILQMHIHIQSIICRCIPHKLKYLHNHKNMYNNKTAYNYNIIYWEGCPI